jgi:L-arabinonolactonase
MQVKRYLGQINCQNKLGENILYHPTEHALYWTDIPNKKLYICRQFNAIGNMQSTSKSLPFETVELPYRLACFGFTEQANVIVAGFDQGIALYHLQDKTLTWLSQPEANNEHTRVNDGRADPKGRFWAGTMVENGDYKKLDIEQQGALYCVYFDQSRTADKASNNASNYGKAYSQKVLSGIHISNGLCFNQDASLMYHTDSTTHKINEYKLDGAGQVLDKRLFAKFEKTHFPDGAIVDKQGNVWTAIWGGACIVCLNPEGEELFRYPMPVQQPTCISIGGPEMNLLFVTSANEGLSESQLAAQPRAGNVLIYELSASIGREEPLLKT